MESGFTSAVRIQTTTDGTHFDTIAGPDDFYPYTLEKYISNSGDVWDLVVYQGYGLPLSDDNDRRGGVSGR